MIKLLLVFITRLRNKIGCYSIYVTVTEEINLSCWLAMNICISINNIVPLYNDNFK